jgi:hypothetical protein
LHARDDQQRDDQRRPAPRLDRVLLLAQRQALDREDHGEQGPHSATNSAAHDASRSGRIEKFVNMLSHSDTSFLSV